MVRTRGLVRRFGDVAALDGVDLDVGPGITGLVGPNGAGKTTLLTVLLGLDAPDEGTVEVLGGRTGADPARVGWSPEHDPLPPDVRAQDLVRLVARLHGLDHRTATERAADLLHRLGLGEERLRPAGTLSTGQRQRVKLAQAVVHDPDLVLLDEPTDGLDPLQRARLLDLVVALADELDLHVLVSSHLLADLERVCDQLVVLRDGRIVSSLTTGTAAALPEVRVEVVRNPGELATRLQAAGLRVVPTGPLELLVTVPDDGLGVVRDAVHETGAGLRSMTRRRHTLEDAVVADLS